MKVTKYEFKNVKITVHDPQSENQREVLKKACADFIKAVEKENEKRVSKNTCNRILNN